MVSTWTCSRCGNSVNYRHWTPLFCGCLGYDKVYNCGDFTIVVKMDRL